MKVAIREKKVHNDDLEDGYNVVISAKRNMCSNHSLKLCLSITIFI